ncbi:MAG TPA: GMC family oxidoreductase [Candidatus Limnocylindrales bacterium]|nr:GMC family oxidoreductase [Candidatus Limnocylindrales bacterium]
MSTVAEVPQVAGEPSRESQVLTALADTFIGGMGHAGSPLLAATEVARTIAEIPSPSDRRLLLAAIRLLGTRWGAFLLTGRPEPMHHWDRERRTRVMLAWSTSRFVFRRQMFQAFKRLSLLAFLGTPDEDGRNPVWPDIGYPGPITPAVPQPKTIRPLVVDGDTELSCDAVVVGSGAGGSVAAAQLAEAGKDVIVLELGGHYNEGDFNQLELPMLKKLYLDGGASATREGLALIAGSCLGGGTVVNYTTSFRTPDWLRAEWASRHGLTSFAGDGYTAALDAVSERLGVNREHSRVSAREQVIERGLRRMGWHVDTMPRNVKGCTQDARCGYCGYGCQIGAKQSTLKTYLVDAYRQRARFIVHCRVDRILTEAGRVAGVLATVSQPGMPAFTVRVRSRVVVAAAGAIGTPALLQRSGLRAGPVGANLHLHPGTGVSAIFDEAIRPWEGTLQAIYSDEFSNLDGEHFGPKMESAPLHPALLALVTPWRGAPAYNRLMRALPNMSLIGVLLRDRDGGRVEARDGMARVHYRLSDYDLRHMRRGIEAAVRIFEAAGAREVFTSQSAYVPYRPGQPGGVEAYMAEVDRHGYGPGQMAYVSFHQLGSCRMGIDPATSVIGEDAQSHQVKGLFIADGSALPSASGVNPMLTIMAMAHQASRHAAAAC